MMYSNNLLQQLLEEFRVLQPAYKTRLHVEWPKFRSGILTAARTTAERDGDLKRLLDLDEQADEG
jgi:hypothetical protein